MSQLIDLLNRDYSTPTYTRLNGKVFYRNFNWCLETFKVIHREGLEEIHKDHIIHEFNTNAPSMWSQRMRYFTQFDCTNSSWEAHGIPSELHLSDECLNVLKGLGSYQERIWEDVNGQPLFPEPLRDFYVSKISGVSPQTMTAFKSLFLRGLAFANSGDFLSTRLNRVTDEHIDLCANYFQIHNNDLEWIRWLGDNLRDLDLVFEDVARSRFLLTARGQSVLNQAIFNLVGEVKKKSRLARNRIFYGPPGTGKTFHLQDELFDKYQSETSELSREELLDQFALKITWAEACVLALLELEKANVLDLLQHEIILSKARVSTSKRPYQTLSTTLLEHVPESCEFVNLKTRRTNSYFWKNGEGKNAFFTLYDGIELAEFEAIRNEMDSHLKAQQQNAHGAVSNHFEFVTFHQSFSYEDFVEGIKPVMEDDGDGELKYQIEPGVFKTICNTARRNPGQLYAIFIDEINRGNVASIFGELITLIEPDKREGQANELSVTLPYSKEKFSVPSNLDIYGTMNTADRSVEALDTALRRRFEFEEIGPDWHDFDGKEFDGVHVGTMMRTINQRIEHLLDKDHCIGHSYFYKVTDFQSLQQVFAKNILPLLQEYFYGDFGKVGLILGDAFVQVRNERQTSFASFDHPDADLLQEKVVYDLQDPANVGVEGYRAIYS